LVLRRSALGALARVAPARAERIALDLFSRPERFGVTRDPVVAGLAAHRFTIETEAGPVVAWDWGQGPTVLLLHGWSGQAAQLSSFVAPLVEAGFHVVAFDQPAHGQSPGQRTTLVGFTRALAAVARRLAPVHGVIAHSLGAAAAVLAVRDGLPLERVVLLAPPADPTPFARGFSRANGLPPARAEGVVDRVRQILAAAAPAHPRPSSAKTRLLVVHDPQDPEVPFAHAETIAASWPGSRLLPVPGLGHRKLLRDPAIVAAAVAFVADRRPAALLSA
jgi:pimeloyl-ACP methyl ester carboxylesterase